MKKNVLNPLAMLLVALTSLLACSSQYAGFDKTESGLYYKLYHVSADTVKAKVGDWVSLNMRYIYKDSVLFDSQKSMGEPVRFQLPPSHYKGDIYEGIRMLSVGDSAEFIIPSDSLFRKTFRQPQRPPFIDSNTVIHFYITLLAADNPEALQAKEDDALTKYITDNNINVLPLESGLYYIENRIGQGVKIDTGAWIKCHFTVARLDGKQIFSSYERGEPIRFEFGKKFDTPGFDEGIGKMKKGTKSTFIVPSRIGFGEAGRGPTIPPFTTLMYNVEIIDIQSKADYEKEQAEIKKQEQAKKEQAKKGEPANLSKYLKDHNITTIPTASGLYYIEKVKGTGPKAIPGKTVKVHYTGTLLNGTKFDSSRDRNEPFEFTLGKGQVIKGWDEGIALMNVGGKATLIIPSVIAYGDRDMGTIPPYSPLVFDVELLEVK
jgi:FKBP-type peptidyl-prolyl cis-trans isomerase